MKKTFYIPPARLRWQNDEPFALDYDDIYFSRGSGPAESRYVFLENNHLPERWQGRERFTIAESGFGSGLNFLLTWWMWREHAQAGQSLHFISLEGHPLTRDDLQRALSPWSELQPLVERLLALYPPQVKGCHRLDLGDGVSLTLLWGEAAEVLPTLRADVDAWFLDGFDPAKNPEMWCDAFYRQVARLSVPDTTFATFTAAGKVRRGLQAAGFVVEKVKGFGKKREMLRGVMHESPTVVSETPWFDLPKARSRGRALVIGAGIAGSASAYQLSRRGWQVTVVDKHGASASGASGNPAGAFYPALSNDFSPYARFHLSAFLYTSRCFARWQAQGKQFGLLGEGLLQLAYEPAIAQRQQGIIELLGASGIAEQVDAQQAGVRSGIPQQYGGLYFPQAGWLAPTKLCRFLLEASAATCHYDTMVEGLSQTENGWLLVSDQRELQADIVVIAAGDGILCLEHSQPLPVTIARGQITLLPASEQSEKLQCAVCHEGYVLPVLDKQHVIGASYAANDRGREVRDDDRKHNLTLLQERVSSFAERVQHSAEGRERVGMRATTQDRLPLVGALPDYQAFRDDYAGLHHGQRASRYPSARHMEGLYVLGGLGSRGLTSALLAAELLACQINGEPLPLEKPLVDALNPARFLVRDLKRGKL